jgi:hypothetical protein
MGHRMKVGSVHFCRAACHIGAEHDPSLCAEPKEICTTAVVIQLVRRFCSLSFRDEMQV